MNSLMTDWPKRLFLIQVVIVFVTSLITVPASAQVLEEVVVTAQKREQSLQDVGISITAFDGDTMREMGIVSTEMLKEQVPGLTFANSGGGAVTTLPSIRGVSQNDYSTHQEMPNAVYIDGVYLSTSAAIGFGVFDLERVEVLRGPQGTLYGRNATGGLVHFVTAKPTDEFEAYIDGSISDTNGFGWRTEAMINGPLGDNLRGRLSGFYEDYDGYWENSNPGGKDAFELDGQTAVRGQLEWDASEDLTVGLSLHVGFLQPSVQGVYRFVPAYTDPVTAFGTSITPATDPGDIFGFGGPPDAVNGVCAGCDFFGQLSPEPLDASFNTDHSYLEKEHYSITGNIVWDLENFTVTSITNFTDFEFDYDEDCDGSPFDYCRFPFGIQMEQWSQELRLNGTNGPLTWQAGFYYVDITQENHIGFDSPGFAFSILNRSDQNIESWAVFGQLEYELSDQWKIIGGLRWTEEDKDIDSQAWSGPFIANRGIQGNTAFQVYDFQDARSENDWSGKIELDWFPNDNWLIYASISRGTKAGGYNGNGGGLDNASLDPEVEFGGEVLTSYEIGFKATLWDGKARLNGSGFYYDYDDYQSFEFRNSLASFVANKNATFYGAELELALAPADGWNLNLGISLLDTEVNGVTLPDNSVRKRKSVTAPDVSLNGLLRKEWPMFGGTMAAQMDFNYVDEFFASTFNQAAATIPDYIVGNARLGYRSADDRWDVSLYVKNLADASNQAYGYDFAFFGINLETYNPPRTIGGQFRYSWF